MYRMTMLMGLLVAIMSVSASGVGFIGAPTAGLEKGQWNVGFNYMYSDMELEKTKMKGTFGVFDKGGKLLHSDIDIEKLEIDDVKTQRYYGTIGYGLSNSWEAYVQLGIADLKAKTREAYEPDEWSGLNFDNDFAWGWGTKYTFLEQGNFRWGASVQMNWLDTSWDEKKPECEDFPPPIGTLEGQEKTTIDWETYDLLIAVGPTVDMGGWNLYGGPFYYMQKGDLDVEAVTTFTDATITTSFKDSGDLEADGIGGFVGAQYMLMEKYCVTAELAFSGDGWALGAGVAIPF